MEHASFTDTLRQRQARKMHLLGQMTAGFAHDINNILSVVTGAARLLEREITRDFGAQAVARYAERLDAIVQAGARGAELSRQLLHFGQADDGSIAQCDLVACVEDNRALLQSILTRRISLDVRLPDQPVWVRGRADGITQILVNLAMNARDAIAQDGGVSLSVVIPSPREAALVFADTGKGIDPDIMPHIFKPFFSTKTHAGGLGLGLSLAHELMHACHGQIYARSAVGIGTEITLSFPRMGLMMAVDSPVQIPVPDILSDRTVLVVDDEEALLPIIADQLDAMGMKVLRAANADMALRIQNRHDAPIDFLLTDVVMPGVNGVSLAEKMRAVRPHVGIVYMTGYARNPEIIRHMAPLPEQALVVTKPLDPDALSHALEQALAQVQGMT